ncbi:MAG: hypothetical protein WAR78_12530, partial [Ferruginibacter sp.]
MDKKKPDVYFTERSHELTTTIIGLKRTALMLSWLRLFSFLSIILLGWWLWPMGLLPAFTGIGAGLLLFIVIVKRDLDNKTAIENSSRLLAICRNEQLALNHQYQQFPDGARFPDPHHAYANDLDLFGHASLFQYINRTESEQAGRLLADWLLEPASAETILRRQKAVDA